MQQMIGEFSPDKLFGPNLTGPVSSIGVRRVTGVPALVRADLAKTQVR